MPDNMSQFTPTVEVHGLQLTALMYDIVYMRFVCQVIRDQIQTQSVKLTFIDFCLIIIYVMWFWIHVIS